MSVDIILIMPPPWEPSMPPLGLAYIAEYLRYRGFNPKIIDFNLKLYRQADQKKRIFWEIYNINFMSIPEITKNVCKVFGQEINNLVDEILTHKVKHIGFSVNISSIGIAGRIATLIKKKDKRKKIIFGGTGCFWGIDRRLIFKEDIPSIDIIAVGEGEETLEKILSRKSDNFEGLKGLITDKDKFFNPTTPYFIENIDNLPFPKFTDFKLEEYKNSFIPILIARGCIGRCVFCIDHLMCGQFRAKSPEKIVEEFKYHIEKNKRNTFSFCDLACNGDLKHLEALCDLIIKSKLDIAWGSYAMIRKNMTFGLLEKMKKAGCFSLCYGVESFSDRILKKMNKFYDSSDAKRIIRLTHQAGIMTDVNVIVGFPLETRDDFNETAKAIKENKEYITTVTNVSSFSIMNNSYVGTHLKDFGVSGPGLKEGLGFYVDENGTGPEERIKRVREMIFILSNLAIKNVIVNQAGFRKGKDINTVALIVVPPGRIDLPQYATASMYSYLKDKGLSPIIYDFNIKLYNSVGKRFDYLWEYANWHCWLSHMDILITSDIFAQKTFYLVNEIISLRTSAFYFYIHRESVIFSLKIAYILKKCLSSIKIIFDISALANDEIFCSIPDNPVDIFVSSRAKEQVYEALNDNIANAGESSKRCGKYHQPGDAIQFDGFSLQEYHDIRIPISMDANK